MMFADLPPPSWESTVAVISLIGVGLGLLFNGLVVYYMKRQAEIMAEAASNPVPREISPQPLRVQIDEELHKVFASKDTFENFKEKTEEELFALREILRKEIPEMVEQVNASGEKRIRRVHARLDPIIIGVAQLCTKAGLKMPRPQDPIEPEPDND